MSEKQERQCTDFYTLNSYRPYTSYILISCTSYITFTYTYISCINYTYASCINYNIIC